MHHLVTLGPAGLLITSYSQVIAICNLIRKITIEHFSSRKFAFYELLLITGHMTGHLWVRSCFGNFRNLQSQALQISDRLQKFEIPVSNISDKSNQTTEPLVAAGVTNHLPVIRSHDIALTNARLDRTSRKGNDKRTVSPASLDNHIRVVIRLPRRTPQQALWDAGPLSRGFGGPAGAPRDIHCVLPTKIYKS